MPQQDVALRVIDAGDLLEQSEIVASLFGQLDKRRHILWKAGAAIPHAGVEKRPTDPGVVSHSLRHESDVRPYPFADIGHCVDIGNLHGKKGIVGMLDEFSGIEVGHKNRTVKWQIELAQDPLAPFILYAENDSIGMHEVVDGGAFAQKFWIAGDVEMDRPAG